MACDGSRPPTLDPGSRPWALVAPRIAPGTHLAGPLQDRPAPMHYSSDLSHPVLQPGLCYSSDLSHPVLQPGLCYSSDLSHPVLQPGLCYSSDLSHPVLQPTPWPKKSNTPHTLRPKAPACTHINLYLCRDCCCRRATAMLLPCYCLATAMLPPCYCHATACY